MLTMLNLRPRSIASSAWVALAGMALLTAAGLTFPLEALPLDAQPAQAQAAPAKIETVTLPSATSPLVAVRLLFRAGSIYDPKGKEGLAALTALMVGQAGTAERSYKQLLDTLYPMAASIDVGYDREVAVLSAEVHRDKLSDLTALLQEVVLKPGFAASDFERNKEQLVAYLTTTLRASNDELLGLEVLQQEIFHGDHPYGHAPEGTAQGLASIILDDVKAFYKAHYTQGSLMLGVAGGYPEGYVASLAKGLEALPAGSAALASLPAPPEIQGRNFNLVAKDTASVGIHFGYALPVNRSDDEYYPLMVANSFLGEHRTFHGRLMQQLRGLRGLNYGDYSYVEYWDSPPFTTSPSPGVPRRQQYFSVWVRPVVPKTAHFALRDALYEVQRLVDQGMTQAELDLTRDFVVSYSKLWAQTLADRLGFLMDSRYYGMAPYIEEIDRRLPKLTLEQVNQAIRKYLRADRYQAVLVTGDAEAVKAYLEADQPSPMEYGSEVPEAVLKADEVIEAIKVRPTSVEIVPVTALFEARGGAATP